MPTPDKMEELLRQRIELGEHLKRRYASSTQVDTEPYIEWEHTRIYALEKIFGKPAVSTSWNAMPSEETATSFCSGSA